MKNQKKIIISLICISLLFSLVHFTSYAENETGIASESSQVETSANTGEQAQSEQTNNGNEQQPTTPKENNPQTPTNTPTNQTSKSTKTTSTAKSNNANLSNLGIRPNDFKGFKPATTSYKVNVPEKVEEVEVYATAQNAKAKLEGTGKTSLQNGENNVNVVVTAEDGTQKTYTIQITRGGQNESDTNEVDANIEAGNGLAELKINDLKLSPEFKTDIYEYTVKYIGEDTSLNIQATPTMENYVVEIVGNKDLKEGENNITILVTDKNGENVATYQVTVNKSVIDEEAIAREEAQKRKDKQKKLVIVGIVVVIIIGIIAGVIIKRRRNYAWGDDYYDYYEDEEDSEYGEEDEEEIPRALKRKKEKLDDEEKEEKKMNKNQIEEKIPSEKTKRPRNLESEQISSRNKEFNEEETIKRKPKGGKRYK